MSYMYLRNALTKSHQFVYLRIQGEKKETFCRKIKFKLKHIWKTITGFMFQFYLLKQVLYINLFHKSLL